MRWHDLLFAHWPVDPAQLRSAVPGSLEIDTFERSAWLGVVPFRMSGVRPRGLPPIPGAGAFPELNVRTYVRHGDHAGVWFFSLDATSRLAVRVARWVFALPYFDAHIQCSREGETITYASDRSHCGAPAASLRACYRPTGPAELSRSGTLEYFLTERYCLFTARGGRVRRVDIRHAPWPLQPAECEIERCDMTRLLGLELANAPRSCLYARELDVRAWAPVRA